jgi:hypothetical protein
MAKKLLLTWNSHPKHERKLFHHVREVVNRAAPLGLELTDAWYTIYGEAPEILLGFIPRNGQEEQLSVVLASEEWHAILKDLSQFVTDYEQRVVKATGGFQF